MPQFKAIAGCFYEEGELFLDAVLQICKELFSVSVPINAMQTRGQRQLPCSQIEFLSTLHSSKRGSFLDILPETQKKWLFLGGYLTLRAGDFFLTIFSHFPLL